MSEAQEQNKADVKILNEAAAITNGVQYLCLDIETCHADQADIDAALAEYMPPAHYKSQAAIESAREEAFVKIREKSALLDRAPVACVAIITEKNKAVFSCILDPVPVSRMPGLDADIFNFKSESEMLLAMREWMDERTNELTALIGFNIRSFDLPKLRNAYIRSKIALPNCLLPNVNQIYDVMREYLYNFTTEKAGDRYVKLSFVQSRFGLPAYKQSISGADVPDLVRDGKSKIVIPYCFLDTATTYAAFLYMTGKMPDGK
ncbi:MAG: ribonuclease H-like domain-containing protein [Elusimicrobiota bacterium]|jgi:hypothetical protein|nr:ribonuclease H-like domain-containing protein [Elusimicrobiota bacterium]